MNSSDKHKISVQWEQAADPDSEAIRRVFRILLKEKPDVPVVDKEFDESAKNRYSI